MEVKSVFTLTSVDKAANVHEWSLAIELASLFQTIKSENSQLMFSIERKEETAVADQLRKLVDQVYLRKEQILKLVKDHAFSITFETFTWFNDEDDFIDFGRDIFKKIAELGADFKLTFC